MKIVKPQRFRYNFWIKALLIITIALPSCKTRHESNYQPLNKKELSRIYGFDLSSKDNLILYQEAAFWLKTPHKDGNGGGNGIDCSYLAHIIYKNVYHIDIARNSSDIFLQNCREVNRNKLKEGDLVFFNTLKQRKNPISHVGIYLKEGRFIHASTSKGVMVSDLNEDYYRKTWVCAGRVR